MIPSILALVLYVYGLGLIGYVLAWIMTTKLAKYEGYCASTAIAVMLGAIGTLWCSAGLLITLIRLAEVM